MNRFEFENNQPYDFGGNEKRPLTPDLGIYDENHRLTSATIWGPVGAEALIAQLLPTDISLFLATMDVPKARLEADTFNKALSYNGVSITSVRDEYAKTLQVDHLNVADVRSAMQDKARSIIDTHRDKLLTEIDDAKKNSDPNGRQELLPARFIQDLDYLLWSDILRYGEQRALALNKALVLDPNIPMGDAIYARDQMNVLLGKRVQSKMTFPIRKPEVEIYEKIYGEVLNLPNPIELPDNPQYRFEGGDAYVHNRIVYVGTGFRTSIKAAEQIYKELKLELDQQGFEFAIVIDERFDQQQFDEFIKGNMQGETLKKFKEQMEAMHLDTYSNPIDDNTILVSTEDAQPRSVEILTIDKDGSIIHTPQGKFTNFLTRRGEDVIYLPKAEQLSFGCNFLALDATTILAPMENTTLRRELEKRGKKMIVVPLFESTRGYGASHCMTGQLHREKPNSF